MLTLSGSLRVFLAPKPCDMRKSFDSLHALVVSQLGDDPRGGAVFANRTRTLIKLLHWDGTGTWIYAKRLERVTLCWPKPFGGKDGKLKLAPEALAMLTDAIDLKGASMPAATGRAIESDAVSLRSAPSSPFAPRQSAHPFPRLGGAPRPRRAEQGRRAQGRQSRFPATRETTRRHPAG